MSEIIDDSLSVQQGEDGVSLSSDQGLSIIEHQTACLSAYRGFLFTYIPMVTSSLKFPGVGFLLSGQELLNVLP